MSVTIKLRKGLASEWTTNSSIVLASGEPGLEIDTGRLKIGNGTTQWGSLQYASVIPSGFIAGTGVAINLGTNGSTATISVSGLINNPTNNRILTSRDSTTTGIDAESNLTFDGTTLVCSGNARIGDLQYLHVSNGNVYIKNENNGLVIDCEEKSLFGDADIKSVEFGSRSLVDSSGISTLYWDTPSRIGILNNTPSYNLDVNGSGNFASGLTISNQTANTIASFDGSKNVTSLSTGTYPSLTELSYVKGVTSSVQTQLNGKQNTLTNPVTGTGIASHVAYWNSSSGIVADSGQLYWDSTNNRLGIGTETPASQLQVVGTGRFTNIDINNSAIAGSSALTVNGSISTQSQGVIAGQFSAYGDQNTRLYKPDSSTFALSSANSGIKQSFGYLVSTAHTPWMTITNSGVGIGTTTPSGQLHVIGTGNFSQNLFVNGVSVSVSGHTHTSSDITNFNSSVSGLLPTISNSGDNRILTSTGTSTGVNAESNATFDGTTLFIPNLDVSVSGDIDTLKINKFFHNNLAVASGLGNNDLLIAIINPTGTATTEVIQGSVLRSSLLNQPAQLQFRQGTNAERLLITPASGEPIWTTDYQKFYIGDGTTVGGDFVGPSPYDRGVGTNSVVVSNSGCEAIGNDSVVLGGINNLAIGVRSFIGGGSNNVAALKARRANNLDSSTNTITVLNATATDFDNTTANALRIVYISGTSRLVTSRTVSSATQSGANVTLVLTSNVGATSPNQWYRVIVVNTAETDNSIGQVVNGNDNLCSGSSSTLGGGLRNTSSNTYSTVGGGYNNTSSGARSTVGGGSSNTSSGFGSTVGGGSSNTSSNYFSTVGGGYINVSNGYGATIGGGSYNQSTGISSVIAGGGWYNPVTEITEGNTASADISTVGGGAANSATAMGSVVGGGFSNSSSNNYATIGGGKSNICSGLSASVGGGTTNNASGQNSVIGGGSTNTASGSASTVGGGNTNSVTALASTVPGGFRAKATRYGELSHAAGYFAVVGDAQHTVLIARKTTTDATANQVLFLDNSSARLTLPAETTWTFSIKLSAYNDTDNQGGWWIFRGGIRRNAASGTALIGSLITESGFESSFNTASTSVVADDTNEALEIRVTGVASKNIRWVAVVDISQVSYGTP